MKLKALSIKQPWAAFILVSGKPVENRSWSSNYVGPLLIHAGKTIDGRVPDEIDEYSGVFKMDTGRMTEFKTGSIIGIAWKDACIRGGDHPPSIWHDPGAVWWPLRDATAFVEPIPCRGELSLFEVEVDPGTKLKKVSSESPATIVDWLKKFKTVGEYMKDDSKSSGKSPDINFVAKTILAAIVQLNPNWSKDEFMEACREACKMADEMKKTWYSS